MKERPKERLETAVHGGRVYDASRRWGVRFKKMTLLKRIGLMLPLLRKTQECEACGEAFACEISLGKGCWCGDIKLSDETRQELRSKYRKCLCRTCLEKAASHNSKSERQGEQI